MMAAALDLMPFVLEVEVKVRPVKSHKKDKTIARSRDDTSL